MLREGLTRGLGGVVTLGELFIFGLLRPLHYHFRWCRFDGVEAGNGVICGDILGGVSMWEASEGCEMVGSESRGESESDAGTACTC